MTSDLHDVWHVLVRYAVLTTVFGLVALKHQPTSASTQCMSLRPAAVDAPAALAEAVHLTQFTLCFEQLDHVCSALCTMHFHLQTFLTVSCSPFMHHKYWLNEGATFCQHMCKPCVSRAPRATEDFEELQLTQTTTPWFAVTVFKKTGKKYKCNPWLLRPASILDALPAPLEVVHPTQKNVLWWHQISFLGDWMNDLIQFNAAFFVLTRRCIMCDILIQLLLCLHDLDLMFVLVTVKLQPASASTYTMCSFEAYCCGGCRCISGSFATDSVHTIFWLITDHTSCALHHGVNVYMLIM